jgi:hypothetical protein
MNNNKKKHNESNVVSIGHNSNDRSLTEEQYAKLLKSYHHMCRVLGQEVRRTVRFLDEAFTKYPNSNSNSRKLKDFEVHESRAYGKKVADEIEEHTWKKICNLEKVARDHGIDLDFQTEENEKEDK